MSDLDVSAYLEEITAEQPCGDNLEYDPAFIELEHLAKGKPEQQIGDTVDPGEPPNWREVRKKSEQLLTRTRDLRVLLYLIRALLHTDGIEGLRDGLSLAGALLEKYWDHIYPQLDPDDDNDPTERVNILMSLCDMDTLLRPVLLAPMVHSRALGDYSLRDVQIATGKVTPSNDKEEIPALSSIHAAFKESGLESVSATLDAVTGALGALNAIEAFVTDRVGVSSAPNFNELRTVLNEMKNVLAEHLDAEGVGAPPEDFEGETQTAGAAVSAVGKGGPPSAINNTGDVVKVLKLVCEYYRKNEPSSPIPILIERAIRLVGKDFLEVLKDLTPDGLSQLEVIRGPLQDGE